jgi:hemerythrin
MPVPYDPFEEEHTNVLLLLQMFKAGRNSTNLLGELIDHMSIHFASEASLMRQGAYPHRTRHNEDHAELQDHFLSCIPKAVNGSITEEEIEIIRERLIHHINTEDAELMRFILRNHPELLPSR